VALMTLNLKPSTQRLKDFGDVAMAMLSAIGLLFYWREIIPSAGLVGLVMAGLIIYALSRVNPKLIYPVYALLITATFPIGWVVSHVVMAIFYFGVITPVACLFRIIGRDALTRRNKKSATTYWTKYTRTPTLKSYFHQT
jgi:hypothetical protein